MTDLEANLLKTQIVVDGETITSISRNLAEQMPSDAEIIDAA